MKKEYLQKVPDWYKSNEKFDLVLSDDLDGIVSTSALKFVKNWNIEYFYDFSTLYASNNVYFKEKKSATRVWADVSIIVQDAMTFDNHVNRMSLHDYTNPNAINPNILSDITNENYYDKYLGSTALVIWDLYKIPLPKTEEGKMLLLCIDTTFKGFYGKPQYQKANKHFLCDVLDMEELYEVLRRHTQKEFYQMIDKYGLSRKIRVNSDRYLYTNLDLDSLTRLLGISVELPQIKMYRYASFKNKFDGAFCNDFIKSKGVVTGALTGRNKLSYSVIKRIQ